VFQLGGIHGLKRIQSIQTGRLQEVLNNLLHAYDIAVLRQDSHAMLALHCQQLCWIWAAA